MATGLIHLMLSKQGARGRFSLFIRGEPRGILIKSNREWEAEFLIT